MGMKRFYQAALRVALAFALSGCGSISDLLRPSTHDEIAGYTPTPEKAVVIFFRSSPYKYEVQSSVFEVEGERNRLVGIVSSGAKIAYETAPGRKLFMVIGENADFMEADLEAGRTYYVYVAPREGRWKARFSLKPLSRHNPKTRDPEKWGIETCMFYENTPAAFEWAEKNMQSIRQKQADYYKKWLETPADKRPMLHRDDAE